MSFSLKRSQHLRSNNINFRYFSILQLLYKICWKFNRISKIQRRCPTMMIVHANLVGVGRRPNGSDVLSVHYKIYELTSRLYFDRLSFAAVSRVLYPPINLLQPGVTVSRQPDGCARLRDNSPLAIDHRHKISTLTFLYLSMVMFSLNGP